MKHTRRNNAARRGITIVEMTVALTIFCLVFSSAVMVGKDGLSAFKSTSANGDVETRVRRALDRAVFELVPAIATELQPNPTTEFGTPNLLFRPAIGLAGSLPQPGNFERLLREYDPLEADDGIDNDGDGLVDEGVLVLVRDEGGAERRVVLCHGVAELYEGEAANGLDDNGNGVRDEAGFNVHRVGDRLFVRLSVQSATSNGVVTRSLETSIRLRNGT